MALNKRQYTDGQTIITAANLNEIQDCIIAIEGNYVPKTRTVAGKALSSNITLAASDVGAVPTTRTINSKALSSNITLSAADVGAVPVSRTVNSKALSSNITLTAADVSAVPTTRTVNNKALSSDITLAASDVGAVPTTRTVNSKALSSDITLTSGDIGYSSSTTYSSGTVGKAVSDLNDAVVAGNVLPSTNDTTDRTQDILARLNSGGVCALGKGIFYTSGITMPANTTLKGSSDGTTLYLASGSTGAAITMGSQCTVEGLTILGSSSAVTLNGTITTRSGIAWNDSTNLTGCVHDCKIGNFTGSGILMQDTGTGVNNNLLISDCYIYGNNAGIYIRKDSEFNRIVNCTITNNYYGFLSRGGNNIVGNCGIDANTVNAQIDNAEGSNGGHGSISNCTFNHAGNNTGYSLIISGTGRMLVVGCNFYYGKIKLESTDGNVIDGCGFGNSTPIEIVDCGGNIFTNCMVKDATETTVTSTNSPFTRFYECYTRAGTPFSAVELALSADHSYEIADNTDYDTITRNGNYYCTSITHANTMTNIPYVAAHRLIVFETTPYRKVQILIYNTVPTSIYARYYGGSNWNTWNRIDSAYLSASETVTATNVPADCDVIIKKLGIQVYVNGGIGATGITITPNWTKIGNIPSGSRPLSDLYVPCFIRTSNNPDLTFSYLQIKASDGAVRFWCKESGTILNSGFSTSYLIN